MRKREGEGEGKREKVRKSGVFDEGGCGLRVGLSGEE